MHELAQALFDSLSSLGPEIAVLIVSMCPFVELRLAIPIGCIAGLPVWECFLLAIIGNLLPVPVIFFLLRPVFNWIRRRPKLAPFAEKIEKKLLSKSDKVTRYAFWGLLLFVAVPLPGTGAWTGTGIAALLDFKPKNTFLSVCLGVLIAAVFVSFVSYGISGIVSIFA